MSCRCLAPALCDGSLLAPTACTGRCNAERRGASPGEDPPSGAGTTGDHGVGIPTYPGFFGLLLLGCINDSLSLNHTVALHLTPPRRARLIHSLIHPSTEKHRSRGCQGDQTLFFLPSLAVIHNLPTMSPFNLQTCARPNILALEPYRCAREWVAPYANPFSLYKPAADRQDTPSC